ncbi:hypothetical protein A6A19_00175 [Actinobacillus delphinicola]|uniref:Outer membrane protein assembly factor BamD n=1 Tax=Actinobacillus delphinicola TaxID=51161 RepID=A0A448TVL3_9PAST|nr:outer membrane protein assembly factor BamD [Actinobacillus delphinicola]MDG6896461.1 hypothetical protein [Actinobacillus delphinicola]VEJ09972.1 TPR repeat-containing protein [Actinobacillus delphinicola]
MKRLKLTLLVAATGLLVACAGDKELQTAPESVLLHRAQTYLKDENYAQAIKYLNALNGRFPRTIYSQQTQIELIYAYFENKEYDKASWAADTFMRYFRNAPHSDYVLYLAGLAKEVPNDHWVQELFGVDQANHDSASMQSALQDYQMLVAAFPNSPYTPDALQRIKYIYSQLARHEVNIAKFYAKRNAWVAVANRLVAVQRQYPLTKAAVESLPLLKEAYEQMNLPKLAADTEALIKAESGAAKKAPDIQKPGEPKNIFPPQWVKLPPMPSEEMIEKMEAENALHADDYVPEQPEQSLKKEKLTDD